MPCNPIGLMAKYPELGKVKTRLARDIGDEAALRIYQNLLHRTVTAVKPKDDFYRFGAFVTPPEMTDKFSERFPALDFCLPQENEELGHRMYAAFAKMLSMGDVDAAMLLGADIPDLSNRHIREAFEKLRTADVVWGPTTDGGYYLIGLSRLCDAPFENVEWGTDQVLQQSRDRCEAAGVRYSLLSETLSDLDTVEDLERLEADGLELNR